MSAGETIEVLEKRLAQWRMAQFNGPLWMRGSAGKVIEDLKREIAQRKAGGSTEDAG